MTIVDFVVKWVLPRFGPADIRAIIQDLSAGGMEMGECDTELPPAVCAEMAAQGITPPVPTPPSPAPVGGTDTGSEDRPVPKLVPEAEPTAAQTEA